MESDEDDEETQASFCRFLDDNFKLPISVYAPGCVPKVEIKERLISVVPEGFGMNPALAYIPALSAVVVSLVCIVFWNNKTKRPALG